MKVRVLGCGEAFDEALPNTCVLIEGEQTVLLDCGYSAPPHVWRAVPDVNAIDLLYLSHAHADHYFGVPALLGRFWEEGRAKPLTIVSQPAVLEQVRELLELGYRSLAGRFQFAIEYRAVTQGAVLELASMRWSFAETVHALPNLAVRIEAGGFTFVYSGDGMFTEASQRLCRGAGMVVHEAYSFEPSPVHADIPKLLQMAREEGIGSLAMVHVQRGLRANQRTKIEDAMAGAGLPVLLPEPGALIVE